MTEEKNIHIENRDKIISFLKSDTVGPMKLYEDLSFKKLDISKKVVFEDREETKQLFCDKETGEEILFMSDSSFNPLKSYSAGILYPPGSIITADDSNDEQDDDVEKEAQEDGLDEVPLTKKEEMELEKKLKNLTDDTGSDTATIDIDAINERKPRAMAISFACSASSETKMKIKFSGAAYEPFLTYEKNRENKKNIKSILTPTKEISDIDLDKSKIWWVNMKTFDLIMERKQIFADGSETARWHNAILKEMSQGDIVLGYTKQTIKTISVVTSIPKIIDNFLESGDINESDFEGRWSEGDVPLWAVNIESFELAEAIHINEIKKNEKLKEHKSKEKYTLFDKNGVVNTLFACEISKTFSDYLKQQFLSSWPLNSPWGLFSKDNDKYEYKHTEKENYLNDEELWKIITSFENPFSLNDLIEKINVHLEAGIDEDLIIRWLKDMVTLNNLAFKDDLYSISDTDKKFKTFFVRRPLVDEFEIDGKRLLKIKDRGYLPSTSEDEFITEHFGIKLNYSIFLRKIEIAGRKDAYIATVAIENISMPTNKESLYSFFQTKIEIEVKENNSSKILPYPTQIGSRKRDEILDSDIQLESKTFEMLYSAHNTYAIGHGTAVDWTENGKKIFSETIPLVKQKDITPDIINSETGELFDITMLELSEGKDYEKIEELLTQYEKWINNLTKDISKKDYFYSDVAKNNMEKANESLQRMRRGLDLIKGDEKIGEAFKLANKAMYDQQTRPANKRLIINNESLKDREFSEKYKENEIGSRTPTWRPFQLGFILLNIEPLVNEESEYRDCVDLLWFPTGGGKTEAYLGLTAFNLFYRRLMNPDDSGTAVITRYTLRLLTAQQFERSAKLLCSMENIRRSRDDLGIEEFSIGIWVGGEVTPNTYNQAKDNLSGMIKDNYIESIFVIRACPWCNAEIGKLEPKDGSRSSRRTRNEVVGIKNLKEENKVIIHCPDQQCPFYEKLPISVVDVDIYENPPSFLVATVDKLAALPWRHESRSIFGLGSDGKRKNNPPNLIIQDELHLISDTLGTTVGFNETFIERFCTKNYKQKEDPSLNQIKPKIICSTATIRNSQRQILGLYGREKSTLFPPSGLVIEDSFFSIEDTESEGKAYLGIYTPGLTTQQTQTNIYSALYQVPKFFESIEEQDPWWTNICYFGSIRELGSSQVLIRENVVRKLKFLHQKYNIPADLIAYPPYQNLVQELTGRLASSRVVPVMDDLSVSLKGEEGDKSIKRFILATSIIEVGIDIPRLSLMTILNQPKNTSQYIQTSGRVGRTKNKPGLIATIYSPLRPRDRSHYEKFTSYHQKLHSLVEPTSVTPFSDAAINKLLHGGFFMYLAGKMPFDFFDGIEDFNFPEEEYKDYCELVKERSDLILGQMNITNNLDEMLEGIRRKWNSIKPSHYKDEFADNLDGNPLILQAGDWRESVHRQSFLVPYISMRGVDKTASAEIIDPEPEVEIDV